MTAWIIRDSNLKKLREKIKVFTKRNKSAIIKIQYRELFEVENVLLRT